MKKLITYIIIGYLFGFTINYYLRDLTNLRTLNTLKTLDKIFDKKIKEDNKYYSSVYFNQETHYDNISEDILYENEELIEEKNINDETKFIINSENDVNEFFNPNLIKEGEKIEENQSKQESIINSEENINYDIFKKYEKI